MAFDVFEDGVREVEVLRDLSVRAEADGAVDQVNALRRAAVVLLVSHFESFLKAIALEYVDAIGTGSLESSRIPSGVREIHTIPVLEQILASADPVQRSSLLKRLGDVAMLWNGSAKPPAGTLKPDKFARTVTSADSEVIDKLFADMGDSARVCDGEIDVQNADGEITTTNIRLFLRDVVKCRNDIAHGRSERKPTTEDVERYLAFLSTLGQRFQRKADRLADAVVANPRT